MKKFPKWSENPVLDIYLLFSSSTILPYDFAAKTWPPHGSLVVKLTKCGFQWIFLWLIYENY